MAKDRFMLVARVSFNGSIPITVKAEQEDLWPTIEMLTEDLRAEVEDLGELELTVKYNLMTPHEYDQLPEWGGP